MLREKVEQRVLLYRYPEILALINFFVPDGALIRVNTVTILYHAIENTIIANTINQTCTWHTYTVGRLAPMLSRPVYNSFPVFWLAVFSMTWYKRRIEGCGEDVFWFASRNIFTLWMLFYSWTKSGFTRIFPYTGIDSQRNLVLWKCPKHFLCCFAGLQ